MKTRIQITDLERLKLVDGLIEAFQTENNIYLIPGMEDNKDGTFKFVLRAFEDVDVPEAPQN